MSLSHQELRALAAGFVLDALEPDERRIFERHLATCASCAADVRALQRAVEELARAMPPRRPPPELRERVLSAVASERPIVRPLQQRDVVHGNKFRAWMAMTALLLAVGAIGYALSLRSRVAELEAEVARLSRSNAATRGELVAARREAADATAASAVLSAPDLVRVDLDAPEGTSQATARALWSRQRGMVFTNSLPLPPGGRVYQVWIVTSDAPISAGLLTPQQGSALAYFSTAPDIPPPLAIAVTLEAQGGVASPSGPKVLIGKPRYSP